MLFVQSSAIAQRENPAEPAGTAIFYPRVRAAAAPGILVLGGAEGGRVWATKIARNLADHGYVALAHAYFGAPDLPDQLRNIPIEGFTTAIDRLAADRHVDSRRIAIIGLSKGAEAALVVASRDRRIRAVVAGSPSDIVWQGIDRKTGIVGSSWTDKGQPLPFASFAQCADCPSLAALYTASHKAASPTAAIPVENIRGPILLLASTTDRVWPSDTMADAIVNRLKQRKFGYSVQVLRYPDGGHFTLGPGVSADAGNEADFGGGTPEGVLAARADGWPRVLDFLDRALDVKPARK